MKKSSSSRNSESTIQFNSPHAPLRSSPRSDAGDPHGSPEYHSPANTPENQPRDNSRVITVTDNLPQYSTSPVRSPLPFPENQRPQEYVSSEFVMNRAMREEPPPPYSANLSHQAGGGGRGRVEDGGGRGRPRPAGPNPAGSTREAMTRKAALGFRMSEVVLCLISFSVMAADKTQGWSGDSFDRYKEYRYCLSVNVIAFAYAGFQACNLAYQLVTGKHIIIHHLRYRFDFFMDQVLAYLLISASSSAATRVDDWQSNWGKDEFTEMASASVGLSFLAFIAFAISSLISGYNLSSLYP